MDIGEEPEEVNEAAIPEFENMNLQEEINNQNNSLPTQDSA